VSTRVKSVLWLVLLVVVINMPLVQSTLTRRDVERNGTAVTAALVEHDVLGDASDPAYWISYRLPKDVDPDRLPWAREVERAAYDEAVASGQVTVKVIEGSPETARVEGQYVSRAGLYITLAADLLIIALVLLLWRFGRYGRPGPLRLEAVGDVTMAEPGDAIEEDPSGTVTVRGEVQEIDGHVVVLDTGSRRAVVVVDGHDVRVEVGQQGQVPGRRVE
jgi:hypothetical protein